MLFSCRKMEINPVPQEKYLFDNKQISVTNGSIHEYKLNTAGTYTLTLIDSASNQVVSREKIAGKIGINKLTIFTKTLQSKYLYLVLRDSVGVDMGKTVLLIN